MFQVWCSLDNVDTGFTYKPARETGETRRALPDLRFLLFAENT